MHLLQMTIGIAPSGESAEAFWAMEFKAWELMFLLMMADEGLFPGISSLACGTDKSGSIRGCPLGIGRSKSLFGPLLECLHLVHLDPTAFLEC